MEAIHKILVSWLMLNGEVGEPWYVMLTATVDGGLFEFPLITHPSQVLVALGRIKPNHDTQTYIHRETGAELKPADCVPTEAEYIEYVKFALNLK